VNTPMKKLTDYMLYITMFPQLIAGPIVRYCDVADQIRERHAAMSDRLQGFYRFVLGLSKKVLIADVIGFYVDAVLAASDYSALDSSTAWITIVAYTFQLYFDFAGYSDMAIGLGRMLGFKFPENFDNPYVSTSISEFWRRWHQTFSIFMKNYLYFPLGGSKVKTKRRLYFNLWFVFLLSGLWHGASWNFVVYGIIQGVFIVMDRLFLVKIMSKLGKIPSVLFTFLIIVLARVFFRIENIGMAWTFMQKLFAFDFVKTVAVYDLQSYVTIAIAAFFSFITLTKFGLKLQNKVYFTDYKLKGHILFWVLSLIGFAFCLASLNATGFSPFIYFRF
jgi:alginate O-acetyltransferase complex protein AlgI